QTRENEQREERGRLIAQLNGIAPTRDAAFGLVVTIPDPGFTGAVLRNSFEDQVARVSRILIAHPALKVEVQGHSDSIETEAEASRRAQAVADALVRRGVTSGAVTVRSMADSRLRGSNATARGR